MNRVPSCKSSHPPILCCGPFGSYQSLRNWHERLQPTDITYDDIYHTNIVFSQSNRDPHPQDALTNICHVFHNIARWGAGERRDDYIHAWEKVPACIESCEEDYGRKTGGCNMEKGNINHDGAGIGFSTTGSWIPIKPEPQGIVKRTLPSITTFTAFRLYDTL